jgi:hypothetical protein
LLWLTPNLELSDQEYEPTGEPAGGLESGLVASLTGSARIAIVSGGVACAAAAVIVAAALPMLWRYDARTYVPQAGPEVLAPLT